MTRVAETAPELTPLEEKLIALIERHGPIRVSDYMADALGHAQYGYYTTQVPFGIEGDFTTAPEISQIFGELIGAWLIDAWEAMGAPSLFNLIELGPGRGTLMQDVLRVAKLRKKFASSARIFMVENSGRLRHAQQKTLQDAQEDIRWVTHLEDVPPAPTLVIANEFFDCLPIRQFVRTGSANQEVWRERLVGLNINRKNSRLAFHLSETEYPKPVGAPANANPEDIFEVGEASQQIIEHLSDRLLEHKGRVLIIDYGHGRSNVGETLQAIRKHQYWPVLATPGLADITAHVDFAAISRSGRDKGILVHGPEFQSRFLTRLGLNERAELLKRSAGDALKANITSGVKRLADPNEMGTLFKALCLSSPGMEKPPGFD